MKRVDIAGGTARVIADAANRGGTWNKDGVIVYTRNTGSGLFRISGAGGTPVAVTKLEKQTSHRFPFFLPDGHHFLFYALGSPETSGIHLGSLDSPNIKRLTDSESAGIYFLGWLLFIRGDALLAQKLDVDKAELIGDPMTVADAVSFDPLSFGAAISASANGVLAYRGGGASRRQLMWFDRAGKSLAAWGQPDTSLLAPDISADGSRVLVWRQIQGNADLWVLDATRMTRLTFDASLDRYGLWGAADHIFFDSSRKGRRDIYELQAGSPGSEKVFYASDLDKVMNDVSPDGNFAIFNVTDPQTGWDLWVSPVNEPAKPFVFLKTNFDERRAQISPDGKWVTYTSNESGQSEAYVRPFRGEGQWQVSTGGGAFGRWSSDGKELYYFAPDATLMAVPIKVKGTTIEPGTPIPLFRTRVVGGGTDVNLGINFDVSRDGRFLINTLFDDVGASPITLLQNWKHH
jgi:serine/threonine-protein kinase